jgi:endonuclease/exonuclease/phosphatase family metal-dependent hydrolase
LISGKLFGDPVHIIVNHWPSRNNGTKYSNDKRIKAAELVQEIIDEVHLESEDQSFIIMGDFNDEPNDRSINKLLLNRNLFNTMQVLSEQNKGTSTHRGKWYLFDQIIISKGFLIGENSRIKFQSSKIFDDHFLQEKSNKYKGAPKRTYIGKWHQGGYSDHFPVYACFKK